MKSMLYYVTFFQAEIYAIIVCTQEITDKLVNLYPQQLPNLCLKLSLPTRLTRGWSEIVKRTSNNVGQHNILDT